MKNGLIYSVAFLLVFVLTTASIIFMNERYNNIFRFDFRDIQPPEEDITDLPLEEQVKKLDTVPDSIKQIIYEKLLTVDSTETVVQDPAIIDSLNNVRKLLAELQKSNEELKKNNYEQSRKNAASSKQDEKYQAWLTRTVKIFETMKPAESAKIIVGYSDDIAKDIVYKMKLKKAAKILALLSPQRVQNITRVN